MSQLPLAAATWFADHHGVASLGQLQRLGLSRKQVERRADAGTLVRVHHGVYRSAQCPETFPGRCVAACLAVRGGVISHESAGLLWNLRRCRDDGSVHVTLAEHRQARRAGVTMHRSMRLDRSHFVRRRDGIAVTNPLRTACDLAAVLGEEDLASVVEQVLDDFRVSYPTLRRTAHGLIRPGWPGAQRLRAVLDGRPADEDPHDSHLEVRVARALRDAGIATLARQLPIEILPGIEIHADLACPEARQVIEVDHRTWHSGTRAALDKRRDRLVRLAGWETTRITDDDLRSRFAETIGEVVAIHRLLLRHAS